MHVALKIATQAIKKKPPCRLTVSMADIICQTDNMNIKDIIIACGRTNHGPLFKRVTLLMQHQQQYASMDQNMQTSMANKPKIGQLGKIIVVFLF